VEGPGGRGPIAADGLTRYLGTTSSPKLPASPPSRSFDCESSSLSSYPGKVAVRKGTSQRGKGPFGGGRPSSGAGHRPDSSLQSRNLHTRRKAGIRIDSQGGTCRATRIGADIFTVASRLPGSAVLRCSQSSTSPRASPEYRTISSRYVVSVIDERLAL